MDNFSTEQLENSGKEYLIHVSGFEDTLTSSVLFEYFKRFGNIMLFYFPIDQTTKKSKSMAFITYKSPAEAEKAFNEANNAKVLNNPIKVFKCKSNLEGILTKHLLDFWRLTTPQLIRENMEKFMSLPKENHRYQLGEMMMSGVEVL